MGKINKGNHKVKMETPYPLPSCCQKEWAESNCPICLERPHNAVLLLCSSYHKGCRPYMCATSSRFSNCLDQYKKTEQSELLCPLCRGQVKGWTIVEDARKYFDSKKRACMQENCSFSGNFRKLKKHMKEKHPHACPRAIDPDVEAKWKKLEHERDRRDVISTLISSTPGAVVFGDYIIEPHNNPHYDDDGDDDDDDGYGSDDSLGNDLTDLDLWGDQNRSGLRFFDLESEDFSASSRSLRRLLFTSNHISRRSH